MHWTPEQRAAVASRLSCRFPEQTTREIEDIIEFCKGAVFPSQGEDSLFNFAAGLLAVRRDRAQRS